MTWKAVGGTLELDHYIKDDFKDNNPPGTLREGAEHGVYEQRAGVTRPVWLEFGSGGVTASNERLVWDGSNTAVYTYQSPELFTDEITWTFDIYVDGYKPKFGFDVAIVQNKEFEISYESMRDFDGYGFECNGGQESMRFMADGDIIFESGNFIEGGTTYTVEITVTAGGTWEAKVDGSSIGTGTKTGPSNANFVGVAAGDYDNFELISMEVK